MAAIKVRQMLASLHLCSAIAIFGIARTVVTANMMSTIEFGSLEFGLKLDKLLSSDTKNVVFSPFSLSAALAMTLMGSQDKSGEELSSVLFGRIIKPEEYQSLATDYQTLIGKCLQSNAQVLSSANYLYSHRNYPILATFKQIVESNFAAKAQEVDFVHNNRESVEKINSDISAATKGKIPKLFAELPIETRLVLANALYFKGLWTTKFKTEDTKDLPFTTNDKKEIQVKTMFQKFKFPFAYSEELKCSAIELAYKDTNTSLLVILPDSDSSVGQLKSQLTGQTLGQLTKSLVSQKVELFLPKFKIESNHPLIPVLSEAGIKQIFDPQAANFSGITDHPQGLYVGKVIQKAVIEVNEEGTEAAAATGIAFMARSLPMVERMEVNRPFLFLLVTKWEQKNVILFTGTVNNPNE